MVAHQPSPADQVEDAAAADQAEEPDQGNPPRGGRVVDGLRVPPMRACVVGDLPVRERPFEEQVAARADQGKRQRDGRNQPDAERYGRAVGSFRPPRAQVVSVTQSLYPRPRGLPAIGGRRGAHRPPIGGYPLEPEQSTPKTDMLKASLRRRPQSRSTSIAMPIPPATHIDSMP